MRSGNIKILIGIVVRKISKYYINEKVFRSKWLMDWCWNVWVKASQ